VTPKYTAKADAQRREYLKAKPQTFSAFGYVYVLSVGSVCKVGYSVEPWLRKLAIECEFETSAKLVFSVQSANARGAERAAHILLKPHHVMGEWFEVSVQQAIDAVTCAVANPVDLRPIANSRSVERIRPRPVDYFDRQPVTKVKAVGARQHPDLILE